ncbi:helix-turn-helix transcriptional regulator [Bacillus sp. FJAT-52991]|uniref:Helix-turn-helix transcriptional regulator n=1 Tax=Bacillus kandeliae TaxID=3129297 RepID=A0ABZ2NBN6_9BACI
MKTNEAVIRKMKAWLKEQGHSYQWLAHELGVSKSLVGHMLSGERTLLPKRIEEFARVMNVSVTELVKNEVAQSGPLTYQLRGKLSNRRSKRELDTLLFAIEDYVGLKEQVRE